MPNVMKTKVEIDADITNIEAAIKRIQAEFGKLSLTSNQRQGGLELFAEFKTAFDKMRNLTQGNELKVVDEKEFVKTAENINNLWKKLMKTLNADGIKSAGIEKYQRAIDKLDGAIKTFEKDTGKAAKENQAALKKEVELNDKLTQAQAKREAAHQSQIAQAKKVNDLLKQQKEQQEILNKAQEAGLKKGQNGHSTFL